MTTFITKAAQSASEKFTNASPKTKVAAVGGSSVTLAGVLFYFLQHEIARTDALEQSVKRYELQAVASSVQHTNLQAQLESVQRQITDMERDLKEFRQKWWQTNAVMRDAIKKLETRR